MAPTAMLGLEGVMEIELRDFVAMVAGAFGDPQPAIDIKAIGRAKAISLTRQHNAFMLASRRFFENSYRTPDSSSESTETSVH